MDTSKDFGLIKTLLNNFPLLKWVKKFTADGLQETDIGSTFDVETTKESIAIADASSVKMFFSTASFNGTRYATFDLKQIKEVLSLVDGDGKLIINEDDDKRFCYIESDNNVVVIAPFSAEQQAKKKKKKTSEEKKE